MTYNTKLFAPPICVCMLALLVSILVLVIVTSSTTEDGALPTITPGGHGRRDSSPQSFARPAPFTVRRFRVTAYCPCRLCCGRWASLPMDKRTTASGESLPALIRAGERFVAADQGIPFGTMVWVPGYADGWVPVLDRGGKIRGDRLDVFYPDHKTALRFGVRYISVKIKEN